MEEYIKDFLNQRPDVLAAYGYGSGVFIQKGYKEEDKRQIDLILVVDNQKKWHEENIRLNKDDYSFFGREVVKNASPRFFKGKTGAIYLSNVFFKGHEIKYGTVEKETLLNALNTWSSYYFPGRFQKPVLPIKVNEEIEISLQKNRFYGLLVSALLSEANCSLKDLFLTLCSLSYIGDIRMAFAENPRKVENIVDGSFATLQYLYKDELKTIIQYKKEIDNTSDVTKFLKMLPVSLQSELTTTDKELVKTEIKTFLACKNKWESLDQTIRSFETNGPSKSLKYGLAKIKKRLKGN